MVSVCAPGASGSSARALARAMTGGIVVARDVLHARQAGEAAGEHAVAVLLARDQHAVRGAEDGDRILGEQRLLVEPGAAQVAHQVRVLLQPGVAMRRQHLGVRVDVHAGPCCLLQQLIQRLQVVAGHQDAGALLRAGLDHASAAARRSGRCAPPSAAS